MIMMGESIKLGRVFTTTILLISLQIVLVLSSSRIRTSRSPSSSSSSNNFYGEGVAEQFPSQDTIPFLGDEDSLLLDDSLLLSQLLLPKAPIIPPTRSNFHVVDECIKITMDEGVFHFKSRGGRKSEQVCGLYFVADPDKSIVIHVDHFDVRCGDKGLISVVDGWELNGEIFPSPQDHEKDIPSRFQDLCLDRKDQVLTRTTFTSSQNAALIQYRVPAYGQGFSVRVRYVTNPRPCNILVQDVEGLYNLENFGRRVNCSLTTLFDSKIRVVYMSTGEIGTHPNQQKSSTHVKLFPSSRAIVPSTLYHKCGKLGLEDYVQIGGSSGLDSAKMQLIEEFCGHQAYPMGGFTTVFCGMTTIRLVSSGSYHNKITVDVRRAEIQDLDDMNAYICGM